MDVTLFRWINGWPESWSPFFWFLSEATKQGWVRIALGGLVLLLLIANRRTRVAAIYALLAWGLANGITEALKTAIPFLRPCVELSDVQLRVGKLTTFGTASSHAANMAAVAVAFTASLGRWGWIWILIALFVGISRVYVGVHYPSQVLLGWLCGAFAGLLVVRMHRAWLDLRRPNEPTSHEPTS